MAEMARCVSMAFNVIGASDSGGYLLQTVMLTIFSHIVDSSLVFGPMLL
jgi:hypothetical protein